MTAAFFLPLLIAWEALYFSGCIDPFRHYHPLGALKILLDINFLRGFGLMLFQLIVSSGVGGTIARGIGPLILRYGWLAASTICFLRIAIWIPFIVYWALPIWNPWKFDFGQVFLAVLLSSALVVGISALHSYLLGRLVSNLKQKDIRWWLLRTVIVQALFISIYSQLWLEPYGWDWYTYGVAGTYAASMLVLLLVLIIERLFHSHFDYVSAVRGKFLLAEFNHASQVTLFGSMMMVVLLMLIWQVLSLFSLDSIFSSPLVIVGLCYQLLFTETFWQDVYVSLSEILGSIIFGTGATFILYWLLDKNYLHERLFPLLSLLQITFFFSPVVLMYWFGAIGYWQKTLGIGLVIIYPMLEAFWGLRDRAAGLRVLLAIDATLPYAIVMMLFSEAMAATSGMGFFIVIAHAEKQTFPEGIAVASLLITLLVLLSGSIRAFAKNVYLQSPSSRTGLEAL